MIEDRQAIATAASTLEGVDVSPHYRQVTAPGSGMVRLDRVERPDRFGEVVWWHVLVVLPVDVAAAEAWLDAHADELLDALEGELVVTRLSPQQIQPLEGAAIPVVVVEGHRER